MIVQFENYTQYTTTWSQLQGRISSRKRSKSKYSDQSKETRKYGKQKLKIP